MSKPSWIIVWNNFGLHPPRSKTMVARRSPITARTSRSRSGKALVNAALISPVMSSSGSPARQLCPQLLGVLVCRKAGEPTSQGLDLGRPIEPQESAEGRRVALLEVFGTLDAQQRHQQQCQQRGGSATLPAKAHLFQRVTSRCATKTGQVLVRTLKRAKARISAR